MLRFYWLTQYDVLPDCARVFGPSPLASGNLCTRYCLYNNWSGGDMLSPRAVLLNWYQGSSLSMCVCVCLWCSILTSMWVLLCLLAGTRYKLNEFNCLLKEPPAQDRTGPVSPLRRQIIKMIKLYFCNATRTQHTRTRHCTLELRTWSIVRD